MTRSGRSAAGDRRRPAASDRDLLVQPGLSLEDLPDVPVGGVQDLHRHLLRTGCRRRRCRRPRRRPPRTGRSTGRSSAASPVGAGPASDGRVAQAGNGNSTHSGTGMSGWVTNIVPGLASSARWRWAGGRKPYSGRDASAGSSRPTTRIAELATMRRSTSLAVCCAPISTTPSERPRSAMSSSTSLIGRGALARGVLVQLVEHHEQQRLGGAGLLLALELGLERHADHEALRPVGQVVQVDDGDLGALGGVDRVRPAGRRGRRGSAGPGPACWRSAGGRTR